MLAAESVGESAVSPPAPPVSAPAPPEIQLSLVGRRLATFAARPPEHLCQTLGDRLELFDPLTVLVTVRRYRLRRVHQGFIVGPQCGISFLKLPVLVAQ